MKEPFCPDAVLSVVLDQHVRQRTREGQALLRIVGAPRAQARLRRVSCTSRTGRTRGDSVGAGEDLSGKGGVYGL